eukprot:g62517.t1
MLNFLKNLVSDNEKPTQPAPEAEARSETPWERVMIKLVVVGGQGVGKSAIARRFVQNSFVKKYMVELGGRLFKLEVRIWDISHAEIFGLQLPFFLSDADAVLVVVDGSRDSLRGVDLWRAALGRYLDISQVPMSLLLNKRDVMMLPIAYQQMEHAIHTNSPLPPSHPHGEVAPSSATVLQSYCTQAGFCEWWHVSAKLGNTVTDAIKSLLVHYLQARLMQAAKSKVWQPSLSKPVLSTPLFSGGLSDIPDNAAALSQQRNYYDINFNICAISRKVYQIFSSSLIFWLTSASRRGPALAARDLNLAPAGLSLVACRVTFLQVTSFILPPCFNQVVSLLQTLSSCLIRVSFTQALPV